MFNSKLKAKLVALFPSHFEEYARQLEAATPHPLHEGLAAYQAGDLDTAQEKLEAAVLAEPFMTQAWIPLGLIYMGQGRYAEAEEHLFQAMCLAPEIPAIHYHLGELAALRQDAVTAEFCFKRAIGLDPTYTDAYLRLGIVMLDEGRMEEATKLFEQAIHLDRKAVVGYYYLAKLCMGRRDYKRALVQLHLIKILKPCYAPAYLMAADVFEGIGDFRQACIELEKVVSLGAANGQTLLRLGKNQLALGQKEPALALFLEAKAADPTLWEAYYHAAALQEDLKHLEPALGNYEALLGNRKYHDVAKTGVLRLRAVLEAMRQAMDGPPAGVIKQFTGPLQPPPDRKSA
jgi:tetratricopeptide (TPR) repeat protein